MVDKRAKAEPKAADRGQGLVYPGAVEGDRLGGTRPVHLEEDVFIVVATATKIFLDIYS